MVRLKNLIILSNSTFCQTEEHCGNRMLKTFLYTRVTCKEFTLGILSLMMKMKKKICRCKLHSQLMHLILHPYGHNTKCTPFTINYAFISLATSTLDWLLADWPYTTWDRVVETYIAMFRTVESMPDYERNNMSCNNLVLANSMNW